MSFMILSVMVLTSAVVRERDTASMMRRERLEVDVSMMLPRLEMMKHSHLIREI